MSNEKLESVREELKNKSIPLDELLAFKNEIDNAIKILQDDVIKQFRKTALASGIELEFLAGELAKPIIEPEVKATKNKKPPKYRKQNDETQTWSGHGKKPKWVEEWLEYGNNLNDLLIEKSNQ